MKDVTDILNSGKLGATKQTPRSEQSSVIQGSLNLETKRVHELAFAKAYRLLYSYGFVNFVVDDTDYRLWEESCQDLTSEELIHGARESANFKGRWFRINDFRQLCQSSPNSIPDAHDAYVEACMAQYPKAEQKWSHLAVYHAGRLCGWTFLAGNMESVAFPRFRGFYEEVLKRVAKGETLDLPVVERLEHKPDLSTPDSQQYKQFKNRMKNLGF
jgi:hypothetical protein